MPKSRLEKKEINGVIHRRCADCCVWTPFIRGRSRCDKCHKVWNAFQNKRSNEERKRRGRKSYHCTTDYMEPETIARQLKGGPIGDLFEGCTQQQIEAMEKGDVNLLLKVNK